MKKHSKILISFIVVMLTLTGCASKKEAASSEDYELSNISFPLEEKVTLKFTTQSSSLSPEDPNEKLIFKRLEEETNVAIDWINYQTDFVEKRNLDIASGELPDAFHNAAAGDYDLLTWARDGIIVPVDDLVDEYMPNLKAIYDKYPQYRSMVTAPDGKMYSFPWIEELGEDKESIHTVNDIAWINVDWLDALGLEMPETIEDLHTVLRAFKNDDPNGNGEQDEIPLSFISGNGNEDMKMLFGAFGIGDNDDHLVVNDDGTLDFTADNEEYKEAIKFFSELYQEGLIDEESFEQDWNAYIAKGSEQRYGVYFSWDRANVTGDNESYQMLPALAGPSGEKHITRTNNIGFSRDRFVITTANKNLELTAKWVDKMYEPLQSVQNNWGTYGDEENQNIFEFDESEKMLKHLPLDGVAPGELRGKTEAAGPLAVLDEYYGTVTTMPDDAKWRLDEMHKAYLEHVNNKNIYPRVFFDLEEAERLSKIDADLQDYIYRKRTEWIVFGNIDEEWNAYLEELDRLGLQEWMEIKTEAYARYNAAN